MTSVPLRFQVGARTLWTIKRRLAQVSATLEEAIAGKSPPLPPLGLSEHGWLVRSAPEGRLDQLVEPDFFCFVRQCYSRYYTDLGGTYDGWLATLSGNARSALRLKRKRLAQHAEKMEVSCFRSAEELRTFQALARPLAALTYQERLLGSGLPDRPEFAARAEALAAKDGVRAWLMTLGGRPIAYLWCSAEGTALRYDYVGHDPAYAKLSPGTVLHAAAFEELFAERRFERFDFTEGDGQHKRQFATGGVACADVLLLRDTIANRALVGGLRGFDGGVAVAKRAARHPRLAGVARRVRRAG